jgi:histidinol-phosphate aminotransferase
VKPRSRLVAPHIEQLPIYVPGKPAEELERELGISGAVKLASNENPLGPSSLVQEAVRAAAGALHRYPDDNAFALRNKLAELNRVSQDEVCLGHGSNELIDLIVRAFAQPGEHAIVGTPSFTCYRLQLQAANVPFTELPLREELYWDLREVLERVRPETKLIFIDNPGNPTSTHIPAPALRAFLREVSPDVLVVIDEAYGEFVSAPDFASAATMRDLRERLLITRTFSKAYGLAGLRLGYAIGPAQLLSYMKRVGVPFNANALAQVAALAALEDQEHLARVQALNHGERARVSAALGRLGLAVAPSQTNFLCVALDRPANPVYEALLRAGVIVRAFDTRLRISIGLPDENDRLLEVLPGVLAQTR